MARALNRRTANMNLGRAGNADDGVMQLAHASRARESKQPGLSMWERVRLSVINSSVQWDHDHNRSKRTLDLISADDLKAVEAKALRRGVMQRQFMDSSFVGWTDNYLVLSEDKLYIAHPTADGSRFGSLQRQLSQAPGQMFSAHGKVFDIVELRDVIECELKADEEEPDHIQVIFRTEENGYNSGRSYIYRSTKDDAVAWDEEVDLAVARAKVRWVEERLKHEHGNSAIRKLQERTRIFYESQQFQFAIAAFIMIGFCQDIIFAQRNPSPGTEAEREREGGREGASERARERGEVLRQLRPVNRSHYKNRSEKNS
jgi:hypothetical protein